MKSGPRQTTSQPPNTTYAFNAPHERLKLFSPWTIAGFGLAVGLGLVLVYPHTPLEQRFSTTENGARPDQLTVEYLKVFLKAQPKADSLRAELVKQLVLLGSYDEARKQLVLLRKAPDQRYQLIADWYEYQMLESETYAVPEDSPERKTRMARLQAFQRDLLKQPLDAGQLQAIAQRALAQGDIATGTAALQLLAKNPSALSVDQNVASALQSLGLGDYRSSAAFYFRAMDDSTNIDKQREYYLSALRTLQSGRLYDEAIAAADAHIGPLNRDKPTLLFLARLAQSSNKLDAAERYIKQLLKLSMLRPRSDERHDRQQVKYQSMQEYAANLRETVRHPQYQIGAVHIIRAADTSGSLQASLPFDDESYTLSYNIFLANRNLTDARLLAQSAVRQQPGSASWNKRLAEVSEWSGAPDQALIAWQNYARISGDEAGWDAVLRLSQGTYSQGPQQAALEHKLKTDPGNPKWLDLLLSQSETVGDPRRAAELLEGRLRGNNRAPQFAAQREREFQLLAAIYERSGDDAQALATLRRAQAEFGPKASYALLIANQLYRRGRIEEAMGALQEAAPVTPADNGEFWRTHAEVARFLQQDEVARDSYRRLLSSNQQSEADITNMIALIEDEQPLAAANLAEFGYLKTGKPEFATQALSNRMRALDYRGAQAFLDQLPATAVTKLERNGNFLAARAEVRQANRNIKGAASDLRAALAINPGDSNLRAGLIWTLIAQRDTRGLKRALRLWSADAESNALMWGPFAAANMSLNRQRTALHWFRKSGFLKNDYLWLLNYAECLEANSQPDLAWRIRRKAWIDLRKPEVLGNANPGQLRDMRDRLASLAPMFMQADASNRVMQSLLRADVAKLAATPETVPVPADGPALLQLLESERLQTKGTAATEASLKGMFAAPGTRRDDARLSASVREVALAYALSQESYDLAHAWLTTRFANAMDKPLWGEFSLMLADNDRDRLDQLLDNVADWLPMYERIDAAKLAGRDPLAQTLAFDQLAMLPHDEELHQRLTSLVTEDPASFSASVTRLRDAPWQGTRSEVQSGWSLSGGTRLYIKLSQVNQSSSDDTQMINVPALDRLVEMTVRRRLDKGFVAFSVSHRQAAADTNGARIDFSNAISGRLTMTGNVGINQMATESVLMRVGGMRSGAELNLNYAVTHNEYLSGGIGWQQYSTQAGTRLGSGTNFNLEAGTHFRIEYPNLTLRTYVSGSNFKDRGTYDAQIARLVPLGTDPTTYRYMPVNTRVYGVSLGAGTVVDNTYTRGWRPFGEIGVTYTPDLGWGHNFRTGVQGSVIGQDVLSVQLQSISATANSPQRSFELGVNYKWFY